MTPEQEIALLHVPGQTRAALRALFEIDSAMGDVVERSTDPNLARIKLAWWRERLEALDEEPPPAEPRLKAAADELLARGIAGRELAQIEPGWATLLDDEVDPRLVARRGEALFAIGARVLGSKADLADAGALYALASAGRRGVPELLHAGRGHAARLRGRRFPRPVRPLTMLARAAARDLVRTEPEGSAGRVAAMLAHRWSGRIG